MDVQEVRKFLADRVLWLGQSGFLITTAGGKTIYIDPPFLSADPLPADYVFLTHSHGDHHNPRALRKIRKPETRVVAPKDLAAVATRVMAVGEETVIDEVTVKTFPAYNRRGFPHPRSKNWVGYLLSFDGLRVYHGGDTDSGAELVGMRPDLAFLPIAGFVTFGVKAGVEAAQGLGATITAPIHYGRVLGTGKNGEKFVRAYPGESALLRNAFGEGRLAVPCLAGTTHTTRTR
jgi:L-ascorbate metabolism protein UlaG (beta-lactamase superfamily)